MPIRGRRKCRACGVEWVYADRGDFRCPDCGSQRSVAVDDTATRHTDGGATFDLDEARAATDSESITAVLAIAERTATTYLARRGFIVDGTLQPLDDVFLAALEIRFAGALLRAPLDPDTEEYALELLTGADSGVRPDIAMVSASARPGRGLAAAAAFDRYRREMVRVTGPDAATLRGVLGRLRTHARRIEALDGDVDPAFSEALIEATQAVGDWHRGETPAIDRAESILARLDAEVE